MTEKMLIAGFGGQGVILAGKLMAYAGMLEGKNVSHIPSYGVEMRGGTANCHVTISDQEVASPFVPHPTTLIVMNKPSLDKFEESVSPGGTIFINSSLIERHSERDDVNVYYVPANNIAEEAGTGKASNMAMLGALIAVTGIVTMESLKKSLPEMVSKRNLKFNEINVRALDMGREYMEELVRNGEEPGRPA
jgi:2-oxoglutarate ferredoxin oxidoreductase subunit gamma